MSNPVEVIVLVLAVLAVAYLAWDLAQVRLRERRERDHIERLAGDEPTVIAAAPEAG